MDKTIRFKELLRLQEDSGLTVAEFCKNEGLSPSTFYYWRKKLGVQNEKKDFISLLVQPPEASIAQSRKSTGTSTVCPSGQVTGAEAFFELTYPNGTLLRIRKDLDLSQLRALIHLYD
jgi:transposase-like protein